MEKKFNLDYWERLKPFLKRKFPQLTNADLYWRHETKHDLFKLLANKLHITVKQFEKDIEAFEYLG